MEEGCLELRLSEDRAALCFASFLLWHHSTLDESLFFSSSLALCLFSWMLLFDISRY